MSVEQNNEFDRQAFVRQETVNTRPPRSVAGPLLFLVALALVTVGGFVVFKYLSGNALELGLQGGNPSSPLLARLEEIEQRLARLEKQRQAVQSRAESTKPDLSGPPAVKTPEKESVSSAEGVANSASLNGDDHPAGHPSSPQPPLMAVTDASREADAWHAASDRIADVVGELGNQRKATAENRRNLDELRGRFDRTREDFRVTKEMGKVRIGSVWLRLLDTQAERQVYSLRVYMDDKTIELKSRALYEPIQLHPAGASLPFELTVSQILRNEVSGYMALPNLQQRNQERK